MDARFQITPRQAAHIRIDNCKCGGEPHFEIHDEFFFVVCEYCRAYVFTAHDLQHAAEIWNIENQIPPFYLNRRSGTI